MLAQLLVALAAPSGGEVPAGPNVVVIYTDDQGYGDVSALNPASKIATPNIDRLAAEGLTFTDGHSAGTVCTPSRYALLTGRYPWRTERKRGVLGAEAPCLIAPGRATVASLLARAGYRTAMVGKWHLGMDFPGELGDRDWSRPITDGPTARGFERFFGIPASMNFGVLTWIEGDRVLEPPLLWTAKKPGDNPLDPLSYRIEPPYAQERREGLGLEVAPSFVDEDVLARFLDEALAFVADAAEDARAGRPFLLYLALTSPHKPVCPREEFAGKSDAGPYGDFVVETDHRVGQLLDALDEHGLARDTLVFLTSDNGPETTYRRRAEELGHRSSGPFRGGKRDIYEGGHRVPFLVRWPAVVEAGGRCDVPVCQTDLFATLADLLGVEHSDDAGEDGFSLAPALRGEPLARGPLMHQSGRGFLAIREGRWKLNLFRGSGGSLQPAVVTPGDGESRFELYDLEADPGETADLVAEHPDVVARLEGLATRIVREGRSRPGGPTPNDGPVWWPQLTWLPEPAD